MPRGVLHRPLTFTSAGLTFYGTLGLPEGGGPHPAVLLLVGSGPLDRDENHPKARIDAMRQLALHLAERGLASLRFDKRGIGASGGTYLETGFDDNLTDARAALEALRVRPEIDPERLFVLGHSEGSLHAVQLAGLGVPPHGIVLLGAPATSGEECLVWQAAQVAGGLQGFQKGLIDFFHIDTAKAQRKALDKIKRSTGSVTRMQLVAKLNAKWFREFLAYSPREDLARLTVPVLALTGSKDLQVNPADLEVMRSLVRSPFEGHVIPDLSHMLRREPGVPRVAGYAAQYRQPVDAGLMKWVGDWLERMATAPRSS